MMMIIFAYINKQFNDENVDLSLLFDGIVIDMKLIKCQLERFQKMHVNEASAIFKAIRSFLNHLNRTTTERVVSRTIQYMYFDDNMVELYPVS